MFQARWCTHVIPQLRKLRKKDCCEFSASLGYIARHFLQNQYKFYCEALGFAYSRLALYH